MSNVLTTNVPGGVIVWAHGNPVACGPDRHLALAHYEQLRAVNPALPAIEWVRTYG